jgi:hypothetical protein
MKSNTFIIHYNNPIFSIHYKENVVNYSALSTIFYIGF